MWDPAAALLLLLLRSLIVPSSPSLEEGLAELEGKISRQIWSTAPFKGDQSIPSATDIPFSLNKLEPPAVSPSSSSPHSYFFLAVVPM